MTEKLVRVPQPWAKVHEQSARALLVAELAALATIRSVAKTTHARAVADLSVARDHVAAFATIHRTRPVMASAIGAAILGARTKARDVALGRVTRELATLRADMQGSDLASLAPDTARARSEHEKRAAEAAAALLLWLRSTKPAELVVSRSDAAEDRVIASTTGESFATAWAAMMLGTILRWERTPRADRKSLTEDIAGVYPHLDGRIRRIAATETARAFNNEHDEAIRALVTPAEDALELETERVGIMAGLFNRWDATLDRRTCRICRDHDGEVVPVGMPFRAGDRPGDVHVCCRCIETLIFLPGRIGQA